MATNKGLLDNPNSVTQLSPMAQTTATQPLTTGANVETPNGQTGQQVAPTPGVAGTGGQVLPKPGDKPLGIKGLMDEYRGAYAFDPETMTVEGRLGGLMEAGNAFVERARDRAERESAARGLRNSSIGVQAGEEAAYNAALPIAQADAELALQAHRDVFGAAVEDRLQQRQHGFDLEKIDKEYQNNRGLAEQAFGFNTELAEQAFGHNLGLQKQQHGFAMEQGAQDIRGRMAIAGMEISARKEESALEREFKSGESALEREFRSGEREAGQEFTSEQAEQEREFRSGESALDRAQTAEQFERELDARVNEGQLDRESRAAINRDNINAGLQEAYSRAISDLINTDAQTVAQMAANGKQGAAAAQDYMRGQAARIAAITKLYENIGLQPPGKGG